MKSLILRGKVFEGWRKPYTLLCHAGSFFYLRDVEEETSKQEERSCLTIKDLIARPTSVSLGQTEYLLRQFAGLATLRLNIYYSIAESI